MIDATKAKWYGIIGVFFFVLISSIIGQWLIGKLVATTELNDYAWRYYDLFIPLLAFVAYKAAKKIGGDIIFLKKPSFGIAFGAIFKTTMFAHWLNSICLIFYASFLKDGVSGIHSVVNKDMYIFIWMFTIGSLTILLLTLIPMIISAKILGRFLENYQT